MTVNFREPGSGGDRVDAMQVEVERELARLRAEIETLRAACRRLSAPGSASG
jgi:hypothetical protein